MTTENFPVDQNYEPMTIDTRFKKRVRRIGSGTAILALAGAGIAGVELATHNDADVQPKVTSVTVQQGDTLSGIVQEVCNPSPTDLPKIITHLETNGHNDVLANANGQVSPGEKIYFEAGECDPSVG